MVGYGAGRLACLFHLGVRIALFQRHSSLFQCIHIIEEMNGSLAKPRSRSSLPWACSHWPCVPCSGTKVLYSTFVTPQRQYKQLASTPGYHWIAFLNICLRQRDQAIQPLTLTNNFPAPLIKAKEAHVCYHPMQVY